MVARLVGVGGVIEEFDLRLGGVLRGVRDEAPAVGADGAVLKLTT